MSALCSRFITLISAACLFLSFLSVGSSVLAQAPRTERGPEARNLDSAEAGMFLPLTMAPRTDTQTAFASVVGGYDSAREAELLEGTAEVTLVGPLAARLGVVHVGNPSSLRPTGGLRVQALAQSVHAIDLSLGVFYRPDGFTEAEGEIEGVLAVGRRFGRLSLLANMLYGQDPEAAERDGELRLAALWQLDQRLQTGFDSRLRVDLGSEEGKRREEGGAAYDFLAGPLLAYSLDSVTLSAQGGLSGLDRNGPQLGAAILGGLGGSF